MEMHGGVRLRIAPPRIGWVHEWPRIATRRHRCGLKWLGIAPPRIGLWWGECLISADDEGTADAAGTPGTPACDTAGGCWGTAGTGCCLGT